MINIYEAKCHPTLACKTVLFRKEPQVTSLLLQYLLVYRNFAAS